MRLQVSLDRSVSGQAHLTSSMVLPFLPAPRRNDEIMVVSHAMLNINVLVSFLFNTIYKISKIRIKWYAFSSVRRSEMKSMASSRFLIREIPAAPLAILISFYVLLFRSMPSRMLPARDQRRRGWNKQTCVINSMRRTKCHQCESGFQF